MEVNDSNGIVFQDGDSVTLIKDLKVKGSSVTLKRSAVVKKIRLTEDGSEVEDFRINGSSIVLANEISKESLAQHRSLNQRFAIIKVSLV